MADPRSTMDMMANVAPRMLTPTETRITIRQGADGWYLLYVDNDQGPKAAAMTKIGAWWKARRMLRVLRRPYVAVVQ